MLKFVLKHLGYGHVMERLERTEKSPTVRNLGFMTFPPNAKVVELVNDDLLVDFNPHLPVSDFLPYTPAEYIQGATYWAVEDREISCRLLNISNTVKFTPKILVDIPSTDMLPLEFIHVLQNSLRFINGLAKYHAYVLLQNDDPLLVANTSHNFTKTAMQLSVPLKVFDNLNELKLICEYNGDAFSGRLFTYTFKKKENRWFMSNIECTYSWAIATPFEILMYVWSMMLRDIDHLCNRVPYKIPGTSITDSHHHYNLRMRYDISEGLNKVVDIIDSELIESNSNYTPLRTILKDNNINLSTSVTDFAKATTYLTTEGSKRKIVV